MVMPLVNCGNQLNCHPSYATTLQDDVSELCRTHYVTLEKTHEKRDCLESGFSLIECLAAIAVFSLIISFMGSGISHHVKSNERNEIRTGAIEASELQLDELRSRRGVRGVLPLTGTEGPIRSDIGGRTYEVFSEYCPSEGASYCGERTRYIKVTAFHAGVKWYEVSTIYTDFAIGAVDTPAPRATKAPTAQPVTPTPDATITPPNPRVTTTPLPSATPTVSPGNGGGRPSPTPTRAQPTKIPSPKPTNTPPKKPSPTPTPKPTDTPFPLT
jgi:prepilin-type N-terminal cleavage/methylation domain-containing protein